MTAIDDYEHIQVQGACPRVSFSMAELRSANLSERLRLDPLRHMRALEAACHSIATDERPGYDIKAGMLSFVNEKALNMCSFGTESHGVYSNDLSFQAPNSKSHYQDR